MLKKLAAVWFLGSVAVLCAGSEIGEELRGVVIEEVARESALEKAGVQAGDLILRWERLPSPPANPEAAQGELTSYFDWLKLEVDQGPRGVVILRGWRGEAPLEFRIEAGVWDGKVRPAFHRALAETYLAGRQRLASGDIEAAIDAWKPLTERLRSDDSRDLRAWVNLRIGDAWAEKAELGKAEESYRKAIGAAESLTARLAALGALGKNYERRNDYKAAEEAYSSTLELRQKFSPNCLGVATSLTNLGSVALARDHLEVANRYMIEAGQIVDQLAPNSLVASGSLSNLGVVAAAREDFSSAAAYNSRALLICTSLAPGSMCEASSLHNLADVAHHLGELDKAGAYHRQSLIIKEKLAPNSRTLATSLFNLGTLSWEQKEFDAAEDFLTRALAIEHKIAPQSLEIAMTLNHLGLVAQARGDMERAQDYYSRALEIEEHHAPESIAVAMTLNNLGAVAKARGNLALAEELYLRSLRLKEQLDSPKRSLASTLNNLGSVAKANGHLDRAFMFYLRALRIADEIAPKGLSVATYMNNLGTVARARGEMVRAEEYFLRALEIQKQLAPQSLDMATSLRHLGAVAQERNLLQSAYAYYADALEALEHQLTKLGGSYSVQAGFRSQHTGFYRDMLELLLTQGRVGEAFQILERFRAQIFLSMLAERETAFTADLPDELDRERRQFSLRYDRTLKKLAGLNLQTHGSQIEATRKELQRLEYEAGDLEARIRKASPRLDALRYPQSLDTAATQQVLDPGTILLSFSVGKKKTAVLALSPTKDLEVKIIPLGEEDLRSKVKQLLTLIPEARGGSSLSEQRRTQLQTLSRELYSELLGPVADRIAASERLLILPDGPLHALPFAALMRDTEDSPQYLGAWKPLHVALSATVFAELKQGRRPPGAQTTVPTPLQLAAFGDPVYPQRLAALKSASAVLPAAGDVVRDDPTVRGAAERGLFDFQPLPHSRREVLGIASLFPEGSARTFLGPEALEERIKGIDPNTRILHLAAHGSVDEHLPSGSFIALTIPEEAASEETQRDNGLLQVWEIFERVRLNADLVVLSACDTGLGEELGGEGLIGLTRAFQYAGARTVMASLWSVQDQATSELMIRFYKHLRAGLTKDRALQAAQQELIRGPIEVTNDKGERVVKDFSAPYYWAGFQLYGDWQ